MTEASIQDVYTVDEGDEEIDPLSGAREWLRDKREVTLRLRSFVELRDRDRSEKERRA